MGQGDRGQREPADTRAILTVTCPNLTATKTDDVGGSVSIGVLGTTMKVANSGASPELATLIVQSQDPPIDTEPPTSSVLVAVRLGQVTVRDAVARVSAGCTLSTVACPVAPRRRCRSSAWS